MTSEVMPVDVQQRADAELGAALRRVMVAAPNAMLTIFPRYESGSVSEITVRLEQQIAWGGRGRARYFRRFGEGPTPAAALDALTEALANR